MNDIAVRTYGEAALEGQVEKIYADFGRSQSNKKLRGAAITLDSVR